MQEIQTKAHPAGRHTSPVFPFRAFPTILICLFSGRTLLIFHDMFAKYRAVSFSEQDKVDRFERLMIFSQTMPCDINSFVQPELEKQL